MVTDHKPLMTICHKQLHRAPPRLQRILLKIQGCHYTIEYRPGSYILLADTLTHMPNPKNNAEITLDMRVDTIMEMAMINFSPHKQNQLRQETACDPVVQQLKQIILTAWLESSKDLPNGLRPYWSFREELRV